MPKPLIIAEKPSAARAVAEALGGFARREGYLESDRYLLTWAVGHLVEQLSPEEYDPKWKRWALESLPILPEQFRLKVVSKTKSQFDVIAKLARQASELINACDAGREGELIFRFIQQMAGARQPSRRLWVSSLTPDAIRHAFAALKPSQQYDLLYASALCRAQGDWLVGMNATRAFTVRWGELYSVGRVQTPTLALIVRREREIESFVPEDYWEVFAEFATTGGERYPGKWFGPDGDRLKQAEDAAAIAARVKGKPGSVESAVEKEVSERPPQLYDLTTLQRDANRRFGLTAAATLKAAQSLYESKLITYPRTDSRYLSRDIVKTMPGAVRAAGAFPDLGEIAQGANLALVHPGNRRVVDDAKVTDHHAIIPTAERPGGLSGVEAKIYGLIARRFLAQFYPEARYLDMEVITVCGPVADRFRSKGRRVVDLGWRVVEPEPPKKKEDEEGEPESPLPKLAAGERVTNRKAEVKQKQTQPPKRFSEASLLSAMEFAGREMDDEALKEAMKGHGLGTPATRAAIIERLKDVGYIALEKKVLTPTPKGRQLVALAEAAGAQVLLSPELTGEWEKHIADIQAGSFAALTFMRDIRELASQVVEWVRKAPGATAALAGTVAGTRGRRKDTANSAESTPPPDDELPAFAGKCPRCGRAVIKDSKAWICANNDCTLRIPTYLCGKVLDVAVANDLIAKGRTKLITGFKSPRNGKTFSAYLLLKDGKVEFEFPKDKPQRRSSAASGYRRGATGGTAGESKARAKTGSRAAGGAGSGRSAGVGGRASRASKPAGDGSR